MPELLQTDLLSEESASALLERATAASGIRYATLGRLAPAHTAPAELARLTSAVPAELAASLKETLYAFVPLAFSAARLREDDAPTDFGAPDATLIAAVSMPSLTDRAICHRNSTVNGADLVFLSAELHNDSFALAFEFFINVAHDYVDRSGTPASFAALLGEQVAAGVKGETSVDAWEHRADGYGAAPASGDSGTRPRAARVPAQEPAKARTNHANSAYADALAIYMLSLYLDLDYADLREREYPLLAPAALAARLRAVNALFPPNSGYVFSILYRRRP